MSDPDDRVERAYRSLAREEPPAALDAAILAASRRALARPSFARRWGVPVSLAAMTVLAVGVTLEMQHEKPGIETSRPAKVEAPNRSQAPQPPRQEAASPPPHEPFAGQATAPSQAPKAARAMPRAFREEAPATGQSNIAPPSPQRKAPVRSMAAPAEPAAAPAPPPTSAASAPTPAPAPETSTSSSAPVAADLAGAKRAPGANADAGAERLQAIGPRAELEEIAKLRAAGRDADADRALESFRRRFPDYRIDDATWDRVKPR